MVETRLGNKRKLNPTKEAEGKRKTKVAKKTKTTDASSTAGPMNVLVESAASVGCEGDKCAPTPLSVEEKVDDKEKEDSENGDQSIENGEADGEDNRDDDEKDGENDDENEDEKDDDEKDDENDENEDEKDDDEKDDENDEEKDDENDDENDDDQDGEKEGDQDGEEEGEEEEEDEKEEEGEEEEEEHASNEKVVTEKEGTDQEEDEDGNKDERGDEVERVVEEETTTVQENQSVDEVPESTGETMAIKPTSMFFYHSEYKKQIKLRTRCMIADVIETFLSLTPEASDSERRWFMEHPQFCHLFHNKIDQKAHEEFNRNTKRKKTSNHKVQGMWMLLLHTADVQKKREVWFVVNGVPIRYGLREHALISGLNCRNYPLGNNDFGDKKFVRRHFKKGEKMRLEDVKAKLLAMGSHRDMLKMMVLFFLGSVVCAQTKVGQGANDVLDFFQRAAGNLDYCKTFPGGRYSFDYIVKEISHTMDHFGGLVKEKTLWPLPGFCIPLERLAFEAIPQLGLRFTEPVEGADPECPRMCQSKFKRTEMKGFPLARVNQELDNIKPQKIYSIIPTLRDEEVALLDNLWEEDDDPDTRDIAADSWSKRLSEGFTVFFEDMYDEDMEARKATEAQPVLGDIRPVEEVVEQKKMLEDLVKKVETIGNQMQSVLDRQEAIVERLTMVENRGENRVSERKSKKVSNQRKKKGKKGSNKD